MSVLSDIQFHNEEAAYAWVEAQLWPNGPTCPKCGETDRVSKMGGKSTRVGTYKCYACRKPFTVKVGTILESSHVPMRIWLQAFHLLASSKKGFSANQLHRILKVSLQTAWFIGHRVREAMRAGSLAPPMGSAGGSGIVEADETFIGRKKGMEKKRGTAHKHAVLSLVERGGSVRSVHVDDVKAETLIPIVNVNIAKEAKIYTDDAATYYRAPRIIRLSITRQIRLYWLRSEGQSQRVRHAPTRVLRRRSAARGDLGQGRSVGDDRRPCTVGRIPRIDRCGDRNGSR